jgi:hypothetical protein
MQILYTIVIVFLPPTLPKLTEIIKTTYFVGYNKTYIWNYIGCQDSPLRVELSLSSPSLHTGWRGPRESVISNTRSSNLFTRISLSWILPNQNTLSLTSFLCPNNLINRLTSFVSFRSVSFFSRYQHVKFEILLKCLNIRITSLVSLCIAPQS